MTDLDFDEMYGSRFLAATDLKGPITATIERYEKEAFPHPDGGKRTKAILYFKGARKAIVCNKTNANVLAATFGKELEDWVGQRVLIRPEKTPFAGKIVPALRLYPAKDGRSPIAPPQSEPPPHTELPDDEIPF